MTSCFDMISQVSPSRESHGRRLVRASTPTAVPHNETRASKPGCTVGANLQNAVQHLRIQLGHIKGDKSTSSFQGQLAVRRVSSGGDRSRWGSTDSTEVAKTIHPPLGFLPGENRSSVFFARICVAACVQRLAQHTSNDPLCFSPRTRASSSLTSADGTYMNSQRGV